MKSLKTNQLDNSLHLDKNKLFQSAEVNFWFGLAYNKQVLRLGKECLILEKMGRGDGGEGAFKYNIKHETHAVREES